MSRVSVHQESFNKILNTGLQKSKAMNTSRDVHRQAVVITWPNNQESKMEQTETESVEKSSKNQATV